MLFGASLLLYGLLFASLNGTDSRIDSLGSTLNERIDRFIEKADSVEDSVARLEERVGSLQKSE